MVNEAISNQKNNTEKNSADDADYMPAVVYSRVRCPECGGTRAPVQHTNPEAGGNIVRHHKCADCDHTFKSIEKIAGEKTPDT